MATEKERKKSLRWYHSNKDYLKAYRIRQKMRIMEYKGGKCQKCGYDKPIPRAYDFHHRDPRTKEFEISGQRVVGLKKLKKEADKCDLLCKNCHAEIHDDPEERQRLFKAHNDRLCGIKKCIICRDEFKPKRRTTIRCSKCGFIRFTKCPPPSTLKVLIKRIESKKETWVGAGKRYGVSDSTIRKWMKKHRLL